MDVITTLKSRYLGRVPQAMRLILLGGGFLLLYRYHLMHYFPKPSRLEAALLDQSKTWTTITKNPLFGGYKALARLLAKLLHNPLEAARFTSALVALLTLGLFHYVLSIWHDKYIATLGVMLLGTSSWLLGIGRLGTVDVTYTFCITLALAYGAWSRVTRKRSLIIPVGALCAVVFLYTPGMVWFLGLAAAWQYKFILAFGRRYPRRAIAGGFALVLLLMPLVYAGVRNPVVLGEMAGNQAHLLTAITKLPHRLVENFGHLFVSGQGNGAIGVAGLPLVDVFIAITTLLGLYAQWTFHRLDRARLTAGILVLGLALATISSVFSLAIVLPILFLCATAGFDYLLRDWRTVFPRNPLARGVGLGLITLLVAISCFYNLTKYFSAWPKTVEARQAFGAVAEKP